MDLNERLRHTLNY